MKEVMKNGTMVTLAVFGWSVLAGFGAACTRLTYDMYYNGVFKPIRELYEDDEDES